MLYAAGITTAAGRYCDNSNDMPTYMDICHNLCAHVRLRHVLYSLYAARRRTLRECTAFVFVGFHVCINSLAVASIRAPQASQVQGCHVRADCRFAFSQCQARQWSRTCCHLATLTPRRAAAMRQSPLPRQLLRQCEAIRFVENLCFSALSHGPTHLWL